MSLAGATQSSTAAAGAPPALAVAAVSHAFGSRKALESVSLTVPQGAVTALLGLNGAGKTTLFSLVTRLYASNSGSIRVLDVDMRRSPAAALARLGVVFQARTLDLELSVMQNLVYHATLHGIGFREGRRRALELLARVGLEGRAHDKARQLSGGQMRRVEIIRALLHRPRLLLLDEPTVGLDIGSRQQILAEVKRLAAEEGLGVLWATHLVDEVEASDRTVVLHRGRVLFEGATGDLAAAVPGSGGVEAAFLAMTAADDAERGVGAAA